MQPGPGEVQAEAQRLERLVQMNRDQLARIEDQLERLDGVRQEQANVIRALTAASEGGAGRAMIPLGGGVQLVVELPADGGAVIDLGSSVFAELPHDEAATVLATRQDEVAGLIEQLNEQRGQLEGAITQYAGDLQALLAGYQASLEAESAAPTSLDETLAAVVAGGAGAAASPAAAADDDDDEATGTDTDAAVAPRGRARRRGFGTGLTLDD